MNEQIKTQRTAVTLNGIMDKIKGVTYTLLPNGRTTICQLTMENGFTIEGTSACVDKANYNKALGEKYAYEDAINNVWKFEGYLLAEELHKVRNDNDFTLGTACDLSGEGSCEACQ